MVSPDACRGFVAAVLESEGASAERARRWAELLVQTSLLGVDSHGIRMLERYINQIRQGGIRPGAESVVCNEAGAYAAIDAQDGLGHLAADYAMNLAMQKASTSGIACVTVKNSNHMGACGVYVRQAALADFVGICACSSRAGMAPWGGFQPLIGLNPLGLAAPVQDKPPFVLDISTTVTAMGKVTKAADVGESIPENWALDASGNPTTDPTTAVQGSLLPAGGHKGYGLGMAMELLSSMLTGGPMATEISDWIMRPDRPMGVSFTMIAIHIATFQPPEAFRTGMRDWVERLTKSPRRQHVERIFYPGERAGESYQYRQQHGIPVDQHTADMFNDFARKLHLKKIV
jgi:LDH2 family malate/lactate/ureidoglycolate dehydrogenase